MTSPNLTAAEAQPQLTVVSAVLAMIEHPGESLVPELLASMPQEEMRQLVIAALGLIRRLVQMDASKAEVDGGEDTLAAYLVRLQRGLSECV